MTSSQALLFKELDRVRNVLVDADLLWFESQRHAEKLREVKDLDVLIENGVLTSKDILDIYKSTKERIKAVSLEAVKKEPLSNIKEVAATITACTVAIHVLLVLIAVITVIKLW